MHIIQYILIPYLYSIKFIQLFLCRWGPDPHEALWSHGRRRRSAAQPKGAALAIPARKYWGQVSILDIRENTLSIFHYLAIHSNTCNRQSLVWPWC